jgi:hypothetical protein
MVKIVGAAVVPILIAAAPALAHPRQHHQRHVLHILRGTLGISYLHNYGPGRVPGTFAYYDGPLSALCAQSAAAYRGQDGHPHPCN